MKSGIYKILNIVNGKFYIGSSYNIYDRFLDHKRDLRNNKHHCVALQRAYNKYGKDSFMYIKIEYCNVHDLIRREQFYIDMFNPEYNSSRRAGSCLGYKFGKQTKETRLLKSKNSSRKRKVDIYTIDGDYIETCNSLTEATIKTGVSQIHIRLICIGERFSRNNYRFKYYEDKELSNRIRKSNKKINLETKIID